MEPKKAIKPESSEEISINWTLSNLRPYVPPTLVKIGNIRDITFGGSPGIGDSAIGGDPAIEKTFAP